MPDPAEPTISQFETKEQHEDARAQYVSASSNSEEETQVRVALDGATSEPDDPMTGQYENVLTHINYINTRLPHTANSSQRRYHEGRLLG